MDFLTRIMDFYSRREVMHIVKHHSFSNSLRDANILIQEHGYVTTDETWRSIPLYSPYTRIYFILSGDGVLYSETERIALEPGYVYLAPCGMKYGFYSDSTVTKLYFHVNTSLSSESCDLFSDYSHFIRLPSSVKEIEGLMQCYFSEDALDHLFLKSVLDQTVYNALRRGRENEPRTKRYSETTSAAIGFIHRHLNASLTVTDISEGIFCSQSKLSAAFKKDLGQSIANYIDDLLMSDAKHRLTYTDASICAISEQLGFCDQFYFSRKFTKRFGISPLNFRKTQRSTER